MKFYTFFVFLLCSLFSFAQTQSLEWYSSLNTGLAELEIDAQGNTYLAGILSSGVHDLNPSTDTFFLRNNSITLALLTFFF